MEKVFARATRFRLPVDLKIDVLEDGGVLRDRAFLGELHARLRLLFRLLVQFSNSSSVRMPSAINRALKSRMGSWSFLWLSISSFERYPPLCFASATECP